MNTQNAEVLANEQIIISDNGVYIVQDGTITPLKPKPFGQDTIIWHNGQVLDVERTERIRLKKLDNRPYG